MTAAQDDYLAIVQDLKSSNRAQIIKGLTGPGSILKETECEAVLKAFFKKLAANLEEGIGYRDDYISISPTIQGVFTSEDDTFDPTRHSIYPNIVPGDILKKAVKQNKVTTVEASRRKPTIKNVYDILSDSTNGTITQGGVLEIYGAFLKMDTTDEDQGVYFISTTNGSETRVVRIHNNFPKKLSLIVPADIPADTYRIEVRANTPQSKVVRKGRTEFDVTVA